MNKANVLLHAVARHLAVPLDQIALVGSTLVAGEGNDVDILCFSTDDLKLEEKGFTLDNPDMDPSYPSDFTSYRGHGVNLLYTADPEYYVAELVAAHAAQLVARGDWDMTDRDVRIEWHSALREIAMAFRHRPINCKAF